eukprot:2320647-Rhodomonas_salina.2
MLCCYAPPTPRPLLSCTVLLRTPYAMSGTDVRYATARLEWWLGKWRTALVPFRSESHAISRTDLKVKRLCDVRYAHTPMQCPVLI